VDCLKFKLQLAIDKLKLEPQRVPWRETNAGDAFSGSCCGVAGVSVDCTEAVERRASEAIRRTFRI
jgi:hypothetical protein